MKLALATIVIFVLVGSLFAGLQTVQVAKADLGVIFSEHFDELTLDPDKWIVQENTNMSGYLAYGGKVELNNSAITLSSDGSSFPCIKTATDPFALAEDFVVEFDFTYMGISDFGNGLWLTSGSPRIWYNDPTKELSTKNIFSLWADNNQSYTRSRISITLLENEVWNVYVNGWKPTAPTYTFRLEYVDSTYTVFVDNVKVAVAQSQLKPNTISFGHPPAIYVPFSTEHLQSLMGGWTSFTIDHIQILQPPTIDPTSATTPTPTMTNTPTPTSTPTPALNQTTTPSPTITPTPTPTLTANFTSTPTMTPTLSLTPSPTSSQTKRLTTEPNLTPSITQENSMPLVVVVALAIVLGVVGLLAKLGKHIKMEVNISIK